MGLKDQRNDDFYLALRPRSLWRGGWDWNLRENSYENNGMAPIREGM
jgi:hypothetical protein